MMQEATASSWWVSGKALLIGALALFLAGFCQDSAFARGKEAGSLLVFPYFDSSPTALTILTVTNTNAVTSTDPNTGLMTGTIDIIIQYVDGIECMPSIRTERLTPCDTFTFIPADHDPSKNEKGFVYVYAVDTLTGDPIAFDYLIGTETIFEADQQSSFTIDPLIFRSGTLGPGSDHLLRLNGLEYERVADELMMPRFFGQGQGLNFHSPFYSEVVLLNFTGGSRFSALAEIFIFNDNEQAFSDLVEFDCWEIIPLGLLSGSTRLSFLESTNHDPEEVFFGSEQMETGWFRIKGLYAFNENFSINFDDPAIYVLQLETTLSNGFRTAMLPFEQGARDTGALWSTSHSGE